jgi:hypothetical protein
MLTKLAQALADHGVDEDMANLVPARVRGKWLDLARAAVRALMEPDDGMKWLGGQSWNAPETAPDDELSDAAGTVLRAMLLPLVEGERE